MYSVGLIIKRLISIIKVSNMLILFNVLIFLLIFDYVD